MLLLTHQLLPVSYAASNGGPLLSVSDSLQPCIPLSLLLGSLFAPSSLIPDHSSRNASSFGQVGLPPSTPSFLPGSPGSHLSRFTCSSTASSTHASHTQTHLSPGSPPSSLYRALLPAVVHLPTFATGKGWSRPLSATGRAPSRTYMPCVFRRASPIRCSPSCTQATSSYADTPKPLSAVTCRRTRFRALSRRVPCHATLQFYVCASSRCFLLAPLGCEPPSVCYWRPDRCVFREAFDLPTSFIMPRPRPAVS